MKTHIIITAIIRSKGDFLIAKRAATKKFAPNQWEFISGFADTTESAEEIILKELKEELNVEGIITDTASPFNFNDEEGRWIIIPFLIELNTTNVQRNPDDHSELKWVAVDKLKNYSDLKAFINNIGVQKLLRA